MSGIDVATTAAVLGVIAGLLGAAVAGAGPKLTPSRAPASSKPRR